MSWLREAVSDEDNHGDIAYAGVASIIVMFILVSLYLGVMVTTGYVRDKPFDPLPLAQAFALVTGAVFSTGLAGLTAYMMATRKPHATQPEQTVFANSAVVHQEAAQPAPAEAVSEMQGPQTVVKKGQRGGR